MLTVFTAHITPRHEYIFDFILQDILGLDYRLTSDEQVASGEAVVLNYSNSALAERPYISPHGLLDVSGHFARPRIDFSQGGTFFPVDSDLLSFDIFSAAFYLLSRYEEYSAPESSFDMHSRFDYRESRFGRDDLLGVPLIDEWAMVLKSKLSARYPQLIFREREYTYLCTFDIDVAYAYGGRGQIREMGSRLKDLGALDFSRMKERSAVRSGAMDDPYDTYEYQFKILEENKVDSRYFFLVGDRDEYDRNLPHDSELMTNLISRISQKSTVGLHPSMGSHQSKKTLNKEQARLESILKRPVTQSRQHYLSFRLPETYQRLESIGIKEEYSMGYAASPGFRAGTCTPHLWYDLSQERISELTLIPVNVMDSTLKDYCNLSPSEAMVRVSKMVDAVRRVNGLFVSLWHNHSINDQGEWENWKSVFERMVKYARPEKGEAAI